MKNLMFFVVSIGFLWHAKLPAQQYASQYSSGYDSEAYQPVRTYPLKQYHPEPEESACLTCNDCQVVNQLVLLPTASFLLLNGKRLPGNDVELSWELLTSTSIAEFSLNWVEDSVFKELWKGNSLPSEMFLHRGAPASKLLYQLVVTDQAGLLHSSNIVQISALSENKDLMIYPNPGSGLIWLKVNGLAGQAEVLMRDLQGREVVRWTTQVSGSQIEAKVPASLSKGIYTVELRTPSKRWQGQWIHQ